MAWTAIFDANVVADGGSHTGTYSQTGAVDSTGADLLIIVATWATVSGGSVTGVQDSKSNTWTALTAEVQSVNTVQMWYCKPSSVGTSHTFRCNASGTAFQNIAAIGFSGSAASSPFDVEDGAQSDSDTTLTGLIVTPSVSDCMIVTGLTRRDGLTLTTPTGFTLATQEDWAADNASVAIAYKEHTSGAISPEWVQGAATRMVARVAAFKPTGGGGGSFKAAWLPRNQSSIGSR